MDNQSAVDYLRVLLCFRLYRKNKKKEAANKKKITGPTTQRRWWVRLRPIYTPEMRFRQSAHYNLIREMRETDTKSFTNWLRMRPETYDKLFRLVSPSITKEFFRREPIDPGTKLELTLRYLATGESISSLADQFRVGHSTASIILSDTLSAIYNVLSELVLKMPTEEDWLNISEGFEKVWQFPHCVRAIDGKHIAIKAPSNCGSEYYNYKHFNSTVLMAAVDYRYRFTLVDIGAPGRQSDGGVFRNSVMGRRFENDTMNLPRPKPLYDGGPILPFFLVGDEAFGLKKFIQKPYAGRSTGDLSIPKKIFNYRLSRARRIVENAFGILANKWRIFQKAIDASPEKVDTIVKAAICLHNFVLIEEENLKPSQKTYITSTTVDRYVDGVFIPGDWRKDGSTAFLDFQDDFQTNTNIQNTVRDELTTYFMNEGSVPWQWSDDIY